MNYNIYKSDGGDYYRHFLYEKEVPPRPRPTSGPKSPNWGIYLVNWEYLDLKKMFCEDLTQSDIFAGLANNNDNR